MRTGDKVRFLHSKGEGIVRKVLDRNQVEVEIEEGFLIPVLRSELVVVSSAEEEIHPADDAAADNAFYQSGKTNGIYLAYVPFNDRVLSLHLINDTGFLIYYSGGELQEENYSGLTSGSLGRNQQVKLMELKVAEFDEWPVLALQIIFFSSGRSVYKEPLSKKIKFRPSVFFKSKRKAPVLNEDAYLFQIDREEVNVDPKKIVEQMYEGSAGQESNTLPFALPSKEVDLHIEELTEDHQKMSNDEMLQLQLKIFRDSLEKAIAGKMEEITFIHGVGNGVLKSRIQAILSKNKDILFFKDAQREKFGYGATYVKIR